MHYLNTVSYTHLNRYLAIPIFLLVMLLMFTVIFGPPGMAMKAAAEHGAQAVSLWLQALLRCV